VITNPTFASQKYATAIIAQNTSKRAPACALMLEFISQYVCATIRPERPSAKKLWCRGKAS
tara:strand:- start:444 stop:626 length:183 start_codon:yes stop_codon:yes gene_type:complete